ncbi:hypothetical protein WNZ15_02650 [Roseibium sp. AS2]|uniref:hypothetical protein n=1 Tax=Roseibium sp. AS2 TaxID=3135781 RepID=UPI00318042AD
MSLFSSACGSKAWRPAIETADKRDTAIALVVLAATVYNAILAVVNAHVTPLGFTGAAATEMLILLSALVIIVNRGLFEKDLAPLFLLVVTLVFSVYVSVINRAPVIDFSRNMLIVFCFAALGSRAGLRTVKFVFLAAASLVLLVLLMEMFFVNQYGDFFFPALYFENTRGLERSGYFDTKLFENALGFEGRFSFGLINHRSSSIFLEQVSLANFAGVLMIALVSLWGHFTRAQRAFCLLTIVLILLTNDSRTMLIFAFICIAGYFVFPSLPKMFTLLYLPIILFLGFIVYLVNPDAAGDDIPGRVVLTMSKLSEMDLLTLLGFSAEKASTLADSGYVYVIVIGTVFSLILFWLFVCLFPAGNTTEQRRFGHAFAVFIFMNMMIGGTAVFSIKIAGLLWMLAGAMRHLPAPRRAAAPLRPQTHSQHFRGA